MRRVQITRLSVKERAREPLPLRCLYSYFRFFLLTKNVRVLTGLEMSSSGCVPPSTKVGRAMKKYEPSHAFTTLRESLMASTVNGHLRKPIPTKRLTRSRRINFW